MLEITPRNVKTWARLGSCGAFGLALQSIAGEKENIIALTSDLLYYSGLERFSNQYPDRLYNVGIAEQNMIGVAAGMAKEGLMPFATTYATFASTRCCDQVRVNMGYMNLGIKLVGLTSGLSVGILGATHMSFEDIVIMRAIPNIVVLSPADCTETVKAVQAMAEYEGPVYLRLTGVMGNPIVFDDDYHFEIGKAVELKSGNQVTVIATGTMVYYALKAAAILEEAGISTRVVDMHTIKPIDKNIIMKACETELVVTLEEHSVIGGLGSAVSEVLQPLSKKPPQLTLGIEDRFEHAASYQHLLHCYGLTEENIAKQIITKYQESNG